MSSRAKKTVSELLELADININGPNPWDLQVSNPRVFERILSEGPLGLGESYMDGDWDCEALDTCIDRIIRANLESKVRPLKMLLPVMQAWLINRQRKARAFDIGEQHYDIGNDLYTRMLDSRMTYTCGYWKDSDNLEDAQTAKLDLICRKLHLKPGMRVLDIGCGWGSFAGYAAEHYGVSVIGITVSKEQITLANELHKGKDIEFRYQDYRDVNEPFDRIVSVGMFEHVGPKNYKAFMHVVNRCLKEDGWFLLHTIGTPLSQTAVDSWTDKYIFPGGVLPLASQIAQASEGLFLLRDWHNFGGDYDRTLMAWYENFERSWPELDGYDDRFYRMWRYFLLTGAGAFRANRSQLWQIVYSKTKASADYNSLR
jgi:cyclopropane-fatty-acyl-phospholipid synthase